MRSRLLTALGPDRRPLRNSASSHLITDHVHWRCIHSPAPTRSVRLWVHVTSPLSRVPPARCIDASIPSSCSSYTITSRTRWCHEALMRASAYSTTVVAESLIFRFLPDSFGSNRCQVLLSGLHTCLRMRTPWRITRENSDTRLRIPEAFRLDCLALALRDTENSIEKWRHKLSQSQHTERLCLPLTAGIARSGMPMMAFVKRYPSGTLCSADASKAS